MKLKRRHAYNVRGKITEIEERKHKKFEFPEKETKQKKKICYMYRRNKIVIKIKQSMGGGEDEERQWYQLVNREVESLWDSSFSLVSMLVLMLSLPFLPNLVRGKKYVVWI